MADLANELSDLMRDLEDRKGHSEWLIANWPQVLQALRRPVALSKAERLTGAELALLISKDEEFRKFVAMGKTQTAAMRAAIIAAPRSATEGKKS